MRLAHQVSAATLTDTPNAAHDSERPTHLSHHSIGKDV